MEIERKFIVGRLPDLSGLVPHLLTQGYISILPDIRIRNDNDNEYSLTIKGRGKMCREEYTLRLTEEEYANLLPKCEDKILDKVRYYMTLETGEVAEIDVYAGDLVGLLVVEVEFKTEALAKSFIPPDWFSVEVTNDIRYRNSTLVLSRTIPSLKERCL